MELTNFHIEKIRDAFQKMQTTEDLVTLLNDAKGFIYGEKAIPFSLHQLTYYAYAKGKNITRYATFEVKKKSGGIRIIHAPVKGLKVIQKVLSLVLQCVFEPHEAAKGFVKARSIVDNAKMHVGNHYVYNIDLKDFFPSIDQARVWKCLQLKPFNLNKESSKEVEFSGKIKGGEGMVVTHNGRKLFYRIMQDGTHYIIHKDKGDYEVIKKTLEPLALKNGVKVGDVIHIVFSQLVVKAEKERLSKLSRIDLANLIAALCCTEMEVDRMNASGEWIKVKRRVLPQGAPTSPVLTNVVCQRLDFLLTGLSKRFGLNYSRYADDITFSSQHNVYQTGSDFINELRRIIHDQGFHIKESKVRLQKQDYRQEVTGLLVNKTVNTRKRYIKQLRQWLYYWERYGYDRFNSYFLPIHLADKSNIYVHGVPDMANILEGKLDYLKMVKDVDSEAYQKLNNRFKTLIDHDSKAGLGDNHKLTKVLEVLVNTGLSEAMQLYNPSRLGNKR